MKQTNTRWLCKYENVVLR